VYFTAYSGGPFMEPVEV
jgi:hypothetical protein